MMRKKNKSEQGWGTVGILVLGGYLLLRKRKKVEPATEVLTPIQPIQPVQPQRQPEVQLQPELLPAPQPALTPKELTSWEQPGPMPEPHIPSPEEEANNAYVFYFDQLPAIYQRLGKGIPPQTQEEFIEQWLSGQIQEVLNMLPEEGPVQG